MQGRADAIQRHAWPGARAVGAAARRSSQLFGEAQDQLVGRVAAGLPLEDFDILPPTFLDDSEEKKRWVSEACRKGMKRVEAPAISQPRQKKRR